MRCRKCGAELADTERFCMNCGTAAAGQEEQHTAQKKACETTAGILKAYGSINSKLLIVGAACLLIGLCLGAVSVMLKDNVFGENGAAVSVPKKQLFVTDEKLTKQYVFKGNASYSTEEMTFALVKNQIPIVEAAIFPFFSDEFNMKAMMDSYFNGKGAWKYGDGKLQLMMYEGDYSFRTCRPCGNFRNDPDPREMMTNVLEVYTQGETFPVSYNGSHYAIRVPLTYVGIAPSPDDPSKLAKFEIDFAIDVLDSKDNGGMVINKLRIDGVERDWSALLPAFFSIVQ